MKMKKTRLFLGVCCMAALFACNKSEPVSEGPHPMTITLSRGDAGTKTAFAVNGANLDHTWKDDDAISAVYEYPDGSGNFYNDKFEWTAGGGTTVGTFTCATSHIPTDETNFRVRVTYPYSSVWDGSTGKLTNSFSYQGEGKLEDLGKYEILASAGYGDKYFSITSGVWQQTDLTSQSVFLHIPAGTQFLTGASGSDSFDSISISSMPTGMVYSGLSFENGIITYVDGSPVSLANIALNDGKTVYDVYIAIMCAVDMTATDLVFSCYLASNMKTYEFSVNRPAGLSAGQMYHMGSAFTPMPK